jgi:hypothetical protein
LISPRTRHTKKQVKKLAAPVIEVDSDEEDPSPRVQLTAQAMRVLAARIQAQSARKLSSRNNLDTISEDIVKEAAGDEGSPAQVPSPTLKPSLSPSRRFILDDGDGDSDEPQPAKKSRLVPAKSVPAIPLADRSVGSLGLVRPAVLRNPNLLSARGAQSARELAPIRETPLTLKVMSRVYGVQDALSHRSARKMELSPVKLHPHSTSMRAMYGNPDAFLR